MESDEGPHAGHVWTSNFRPYRIDLLEQAILHSFDDKVLVILVIVDCLDHARASKVAGYHLTGRDVSRWVPVCHDSFRGLHVAILLIGAPSVSRCLRKTSEVNVNHLRREDLFLEPVRWRIKNIII